MEPGKIILVKNIIFSSREGIKHFDHATGDGRPSIIVSEYNGSYFICTLDSKITATSKKIELPSKNIKYQSNFNFKDSEISVYPFREIKACGYPVIGEVKEKYYLRILNCILNYYSNFDYENYTLDGVLDDLKNQTLRLKK